MPQGVEPELWQLGGSETDGGSKLAAGTIEKLLGDRVRMIEGVDTACRDQDVSRGRSDRVCIVRRKHEVLRVVVTDERVEEVAGIAVRGQATRHLPLLITGHVLNLCA
jgi:hypothetical protein